MRDGREKGGKFQFTPLREGRPFTPARSACASIFQFTPLREGRLTNFLHRNMMKLFQFTPLREGRQFEKSPGKGYQLLFQFTPLREGRPLPLWKLYPFREFQFTPLREGRLLPQVACKWIKYFNSRPSARGDYNELLRRGLINISIHAPPRGATI